MKKVAVLAALFLGFSFGFGQDEKPKKEPLTKKGQMLIFWGWNRAAFSNSDIHFKGNGYDFVLHKVVAHDRPSEF